MIDFKYSQTHMSSPYFQLMMVALGQGIMAFIHVSEVTATETWLSNSTSVKAKQPAFIPEIRIPKASWQISGVFGQLNSPIETLVELHVIDMTALMHCQANPG